MNKKLPFDTPPGYFEGLGKQMLAHVQQRAPEAKPTVWLQVKPLLTMAAAMALLVILGKVVLMLVGSPSNSSTSLADEAYLSSYHYSDIELIEYTQQTTDTAAPPDEEVLEYLLCDNDLEYIAYAY